MAAPPQQQPQPATPDSELAPAPQTRQQQQQQQQRPALGARPDALHLSDREASFVTPREQTNVVSEADSAKAYMPLGSGYSAQGVGGLAGEPLAYEA